MQRNSISSSTLSLSAALVASLCAGCTTDGSDGFGEIAQASSSTASVTPLPSFASTPNIEQAIGLLARPRVIAVVRTVSGFQIYRCDQAVTGQQWKLRTPLAGFEPSPDVQRSQLNRARLESLVGGYHYRSDFGGLLASLQVEVLGLALPLVTAPVWDFTFQPDDAPLRREVFAGRLLAQDVTSPANVPMFLLEVRGRAVDPGAPSAVASATHVLRWNTLGGLAPAASSCNSAALGQEFQAPYSAEYFFLAAAPELD